MKKLHTAILIAICFIGFSLQGCKKAGSVDEYEEHRAIRDRVISQCIVNKGVPILDTYYTRVIRCDTFIK